MGDIFKNFDINFNETSTNYNNNFEDFNKFNINNNIENSNSNIYDFKIDIKKEKELSDKLYTLIKDTNIKGENAKRIFESYNINDTNLKFKIWSLLDTNNKKYLDNIESIILIQLLDNISKGYILTENKLPNDLIDYKLSSLKKLNNKPDNLEIINKIKDIISNDKKANIIHTKRLVDMKHVFNNKLKIEANTFNEYLKNIENINLNK